MHLKVTIDESNSGYGYQNVLRIYHKEKCILEEYDGGEPEDATFERDYAWIEDAILEAYRLGLADGQTKCTMGNRNQND